MKNASKYFGYIPIPDKKKKIEIVDHDLYSKKDL